jgi:hypothetical protein
VDVAILAGNDYTKPLWGALAQPLHHRLPFTPGNTSPEEVARWLCAQEASCAAAASAAGSSGGGGFVLEHHPALADVDAALAAVYDVEAGRTNPFLHLSMHLSISEQVSIDQPRGIKQAVELLTARRGSVHDAHHEVMECLGEMMWASQRSGLPPDGDRYIEAVRRRATRD